MILYEGPSMLNGMPIVSIMTGASRNEKTGPMHQVWILHRETKPTAAIRNGEDEAVCGTCPARGKWCYVFRGHDQVWKAYTNDKYERLSLNSLRKAGERKTIRLGAYGDPAAVPIEVWDRLLSKAAGWTGYTHMWRTCNPALRRWCMASVDTEPEFLQAASAGWRCFWVVPDAAAARAKYGKQAALCPHKSTGLQCLACLACSGVGTSFSGHIIEEVHGKATRTFRQFVARSGVQAPGVLEHPQAVLLSDGEEEG